MCKKQSWLFPVCFMAVLVFSLALCLTANGECFSGSDWTWPRSTPEEQGLDPAKLQELVDLIRAGEEYPRLHCLLVIRHGKLVLEEYFNWQPERLHTLQSVSKSFTSALVGIAIKQAKFKGVHEKMLDFFPDKNPADIDHLDSRKAAICLQDLLTMRSGTDYHESGPDSPHFKLNALRSGWDTFYLNRPMRTEPGTSFLYDSGAVIITSSMLKNRTGKHAHTFAEDTLFKSLDITKKFWIANEEGHPHTGGGLNLAPLDTAKLGQLYLDRGQWAGTEVVSEAWVSESTKRHVNLQSRRYVVGYGYWWWILEPDPDGRGEEDIYAAMGFKAQYIFVVPEHDMVVVVNGDTRNRTDQQKPIEFLYTHILPSIKR
jgi:CubicO group peptidase (beta-lactamase class C family)